jgi:uncharacterized protein DUF2752
LTVNLERTKAVPLLLVVFAAAGATAVLFFFPPEEHAFYPRCFFHTLTGLQCPGCGSLRAAHRLLHGEVASAFRFNPLMVTLAPLFAIWLAAYGIARMNGREIWVPLTRPIWAWTLLIVGVLFGILRNLLR